MALRVNIKIIRTRRIMVEINVLEDIKWVKLLKIKAI